MTNPNLDDVKALAERLPENVRPSAAERDSIETIRERIKFGDKMFASEVMDLLRAFDRLASQRDETIGETRAILAGADVHSLPNDYTLQQIAAARMEDIERLQSAQREDVIDREASARIIDPEAFRDPPHPSQTDAMFRPVARHNALAKADAIIRPLPSREAIIEDCAKVAEDHFNENGWHQYYVSAGFGIAKAIRSLAAQPPSNNVEDGVGRNSTCMDGSGPNDGTNAELNFAEEQLSRIQAIIPNWRSFRNLPEAVEVILHLARQR